MPAYNRAYCIKKAINSLLKQSYQNFELIIVDDGSTDETEELICETYTKEIASGKIVYQKNEHKGAAAARNTGLSLAKGKWIAYLDTDNTIIKDFLKTYKQAIKKHPKNKIFYAQMRRINQDKVVGHAWDEQEIFTQPYIDMGTFVHYKECTNKYGSFDEKLSRLIDYEFILRLTRFYQPVFIEKVVLNYNDAADVPRITTTEDRTQALCYIKDKYKGYEEQIKQNNLTAKELKGQKMNKFGLKLARLLHLISKDKYNEKRQIALIEASPLFDKKWYLNQNPDVKKRKMRAAKHYIKIGYKENRNPSPYFDGKDYLKRYKDIAKSGQNPLVHYLLHGAKEGRYYNEVVCPASLLVQNDIDFQPKISVVIPVYNAEAFLDELLDSITGQTLKEIEIICVDDGSTDNSLEILKKYAQKDKRITIMQQNNMHAGVARNSGISIAKGEYIHFMDADDWLYDKDVYKNLYQIAKERNFCNIIRFKGKAYDNITKEEKHIKEEEAIIKVLETIDKDNDFLELWEEYEKAETPEAKFMKNVDQLEFLLQACAYGYDAKYFKRSLSKIEDPYCKELANSAIEISNGNKEPKVVG